MNLQQQPFSRTAHVLLHVAIRGFVCTHFCYHASCISQRTNSSMDDSRSAGSCWHATVLAKQFSSSNSGGWACIWLKTSAKEKQAHIALQYV